MTPQDPNLDPFWNKLPPIRDEDMDPAVIAAAAGRVQQRLAEHHTLHTCADFQALMPDYRAGKLRPRARAPPQRPHPRVRGLLQSASRYPVWS